SNVLRLLDLHMGAIFGALREGRPVGTFTERFDTSRGSEARGLEVLWPVDVEAAVGSEQFRSLPDAMVVELFKALDAYGVGVPCLRFVADSLGAPLAFSADAGHAITESATSVPWSDLSRVLTSTTGRKYGVGA